MAVLISELGTPVSYSIASKKQSPTLYGLWITFRPGGWGAAFVLDRGPPPRRAAASHDPGWVGSCRLQL